MQLVYFLKEMQVLTQKRSPCQNHCLTTLNPVYSADLSGKPPVLTGRKNITLIHTNKNHTASLHKRKHSFCVEELSFIYQLTQACFPCRLCIFPFIKNSQVFIRCL